MTMLSVAEARTEARNKLQKWMTEWASGRAEGNFTCKIGELNERQALSNQSAAAEWTRAWRDTEKSYGLSVEWTSRNWARVGRQTLPTRLRLYSADEIARFVGGDVERDWHIYKARGATVRARLGDTAAVRSTLKSKLNQLVKFDSAEFENVVRVVEWLRDHHQQPMRPRQLPIHGVNSKWFEHREGLVTSLLGAIGHGDAVTILKDEASARLRILDPNIYAGGLSDITAPIGQLEKFEIYPTLVFIFENLENVLSMPDWPGAVAIHGGGRLVNSVINIGWLKDTRIIYWGDLDLYGFAILANLRSHLPDIESVLMDEATLVNHKDLWVQGKPYRGEIEPLTDSERRAAKRIEAEGQVSLEQERIPWDTALNQLRTAAEGETSGHLGEGTGRGVGTERRLGEGPDDDR